MCELLCMYATVFLYICGCVCVCMCAYMCVNVCLGLCEGVCGCNCLYKFRNESSDLNTFKLIFINFLLYVFMQ